MQLTSSVFKNGEVIPDKYGRDFENINPPLMIEGAPVGTVSFVLIMDDPDMPAGASVPVWDHWVVYNIPVDTREIPENWQVIGVRGQGTRGELDYGGPRPPDKEHRYFFKILALDCLLDLPEGATRRQVLESSAGHILDQVELMGRFAPKT